MTTRAVIEVENLTLRFGDLVLLENTSFAINEGEVFVILGGSGCGKSSLLKVLMGLVEPSAGRVLIDGEDFTAAGGAARLAILRKFGILFQSGGLFASMTLAENVALPMQAYTALSVEEIRALVDLRLQAVGLRGYESYLPSEISGGMKKRAGLARAMALDPRILMFDEPSAGLDPVSSAALDALIVHLNTTLGTTMIVVTHELDSVMSIAGRAIMLDKQARGIIAEGKPQDLRQYRDDPRVYNFFNRVYTP